MWDSILKTLSKEPAKKGSRRQSCKGKLGRNGSGLANVPRCSASIYRTHNGEQQFWVPESHNPAQPTLPRQRRRVRFADKVDVVIFES